MRTSLFISVILSASSLFAATMRYVSPAGMDTGDCTDTSMLNPKCLTLQYALMQSSSGDTINFDAGTYTDMGAVPVEINTSVILKGFQAGNDARDPRVGESIIEYDSGLWIKANNVTIDGFTIQKSKNAYIGYGIVMLPNIDGTTIINNIFTDNIIGLGVANEGTNQCLIKHNLFLANNRPGAASGTGIYTDEFVGGKTKNVLIDENDFKENISAGIDFSVGNSSFTAENIIITNNNIDGCNLMNVCGSGMFFVNTDNSTVEDNNITNVAAGIGIFDGVSNLFIMRNNIQTGTLYGIRINNFLTPPGPPAEDLFIHLNNIVDFDVAGMSVVVAPTTPLDYATCNWWGSDTGPFSMDFNPDGTGDSVVGAIASAEVFEPWLLAEAPDGPCGESMEHLSKSFNPSTIRQKEISELTITLTNENDSAAMLIEPLVDVLPDGVKVAGESNNTCGGTLVAIFGSQTITLTGGSIPAQGSCAITVQVTALRKDSYTNVLPEGALSTNRGKNDAPAEAVLNVINRPIGGGNRSYCYLDVDLNRCVVLEPPILPPVLAPVAVTVTEVVLDPKVVVIEDRASIAPTPQINLEKNSSGCTGVSPSDPSLAFLFMLLAYFYSKIKMLSRIKKRNL